MMFELSCKQAAIKGEPIQFHYRLCASILNGGGTFFSLVIVGLKVRICSTLKKNPDNSFVR